MAETLLFFEPGERFGTMTEEGIVKIWEVDDVGYIAETTLNARVGEKNGG